MACRLKYKLSHPSHGSMKQQMTKHDFKTTSWFSSRKHVELQQPHPEGLAPCIPSKPKQVRAKSHLTFAGLCQAATAVFACQGRGCILSLFFFFCVLWFGLAKSDWFEVAKSRLKWHYFFGHFWRAVCPKAQIAKMPWPSLTPNIFCEWLSQIKFGIPKTTATLEHLKGSRNSSTGSVTIHHHLTAWPWSKVKKSQSSTVSDPWTF